VLSLQVVFAHVWLLLIRTSSLAPAAVERTLTALMFASAAETLTRFLIVAVSSSWRDFLYVEKRGDGGGRLSRRVGGINLRCDRTRKCCA
jgi:hypothetical protein